MILIVDDDQDTADLLRRLFARHRLPAACACSGRAALKAMGAKKPSVVLLDVMMPEMDGIEVLRRMRLDASLSDLPVMMYSASNDARHEQQARELGAAEFLKKGSVDFLQLVCTLKPYVAGADAPDAER